MKAAVIDSYGDHQVFRITDLPVPEIGHDDVLIKVFASSMNPVDWKIRKGNWKYIFGSHFPIVLGFDAAGEVIKTGLNVNKFKPGDKVYGRLNKKYGKAYAEYACTHQSTLAFIPKNLNYFEAAAIPLAAVTALQAIRDHGKAKKGQNILIIGATGGVGHYAVQIAEIFGLEVTAVSSDNHKTLIQLLNPHHWIDYDKTDILKLNSQFNIILDVVGKYTFLSCKKLLKPHGNYVTLLPRPKVLVHKILSVFTKGKKTKTFFMHSNANDLEFLKTYILNGKLKPHIDKVFTLEDIAKAHEYAEQGHTEGKVVIDIAGS